MFCKSMELLKEGKKPSSECMNLLNKYKKIPEKLSFVAHAIWKHLSNKYRKKDDGGEWGVNMNKKKKKKYQRGKKAEEKSE